MNSEKQSRQWAHGADMVVGQLEAQGVKQVFGIPGAKIDKVFDSLLDSSIEIIPVRHEANAAFMAAAVGAVDRQSRGGAGHLRTGLFEPDHRYCHRQQRRRPGGSAGRGGEAGR